MRPRVSLPAELPPPAADLLAARAEVSRRRPGQPLAEAARGQAGLLTLLSERVDAAVLDAAGAGLKVVANYAVGYDNIDLGETRRRGIVVTNTPGVLTEATADLAWVLLLAAARRAIEGDRLVRTGGWRGWEPEQLLGVDVFGRTLGVVGAGRIGQAVARRAAGFAMKLLYVSPGPVIDLEERGARRVGLDECLAASDFVSLHVPLRDSTRHLLGERELGLMKPGAILINTARGPVVDEAALVRALRGGRLRAAGLDVYEREPALEPGLSELPNVVLLPHLGSATKTTRARMSQMAAESILDVLEGRRPPHVV